ncbi:MAG: LCP family protein [Firmicutes bacterium]|nr:LCP family protein [Bacillota bacterium]
MKHSDNRASGFVIYLSAIVAFALMFVFSTAALTLYRMGTTEEEIIVTGEDGEVIKQTTSSPFTIFHTTETDERLSRDMTPIVVDESSPFYEAFKTQDRVNVLLMGLADGNTDTIMLASYDMENQKVSIISVPRDSFVEVESYKSYAENKINAQYRKNGVVGTATAVSQLLYGMPIHYYVIVGYEDVRAIMDIIGGVEVEIPFHMKYDDTTPGKELHIDIPKGLQTIDSSNVVEFLRFRHTNPWWAEKGYKSYTTGDIGRTAVQREFVQKVLSECLKKNNLLDVVKFSLENVESDLTLTTAIKVAKKAASGLSAENIEMYSMPGHDTMLHNLSFWINDEEQVYTMLEQIYGLAEPEEGSTEEGQPEKEGQ